MKKNTQREMRTRPGTVRVDAVVAEKNVTKKLHKFIPDKIKMIGVSNLQRFIATMTTKLTH